jgi:hypothetical protein
MARIHQCARGDGGLPAIFERTLVLSADVPARAKLCWMFIGPHAGFTVELTSSKVQLVQCYYDSTGLYTGQGPEDSNEPA